MKAIEEYYRDQKNSGNFSGSLDEFAASYGLTLEMYILKSGVSLEGVDKILIEISW